MSTVTYTNTYTVVDVRRVVDSFAADLDMIVQATGLADDGWVTDVVHDMKQFAENGYLARVDIILFDGRGNVVRAAKYEVSTDASLWTTQRPGNSLWPRTPGGDVGTVVSYTSKWTGLSEEGRRAFRQKLRRGWSPSTIDLRYPGLIGEVDRRYASNAYGMERTTYRGS